MITFLSALLGLLGSAFPDFLQILRDKRDRAHELEILRLQMEQQEKGHVARLEEIQSASDASEMAALYRTYATGIHWVDALNGTVRPILAYAFFLLYFSVKWMQFALLYETPFPWSVADLWGEEDQAIFAAIIAFYFGQRAMMKLRKG